MRNTSFLLISISLYRDRSFRSTPKIGHDLAKQPVTIDRNHRSRLSEMTGHDAPKYAMLIKMSDIGLILNFVGAVLLGVSSQFGSAAGWGGKLVWKGTLWHVLNGIGWFLLAFGFIIQFFAKFLDRLIS